MLGTLLPDIIRSDAKNAVKEKKLVEAAEKMMKELQDSGLSDRYADMQQRLAPKVDRKLVGARL